jgi:hypothetical protein
MKPTIAVLFLVGLALSVDAQTSTATRRLQSPGKKASEDFTHVVAVRELSNGQVIVADDRENKLMLVDFSGGAARSIARIGDGPGEIRRVGAVLALNGDSTLVADGGTRWVIYNKGEPVRTIGTTSYSSFSQPIPLCGADRHGNVCFLRPRKIRASQPGLPAFGTFSDAESLAVIRVSLTHENKVDTLLGLIGRFLSVARRAKEGMNWIYYNPLAVEDQVMIDRDGWLAFVRTGPYQVYWQSPDGNVSRGPVLDQPLQVDEAMKLRALREYNPGQARAGFTPSEFEKWPMFLPAFHNNALQLTAQGRLVIKRIVMPGREDHLYDVVDRTGKLVDRVAIAGNQRIVGFGLASVYLVTADSDGLETLTRHPWPQ